MKYENLRCLISTIFKCNRVTGVKDKNGVMIRFGDIVEYCGCGSKYDEWDIGVRGIVVYNPLYQYAFVNINGYNKRELYHISRCVRWELYHISRCVRIVGRKSKKEMWCDLIGNLFGNSVFD